MVCESAQARVEPAELGLRAGVVRALPADGGSNVTWSVLFFGLRSPIAALGGIAMLWVAIVATIVAFSRTSPAASWIMAPYLAWVTFASALNLAIWRLNG